VIGRRPTVAVLVAVIGVGDGGEAGEVEEAKTGYSRQAASW